MRVIALWGVALLLTAPAQAQSVKAGIEAWRSKKYAQAVAIWRPLAARGEADAAFNLGQAYKLGRGVPADLAAAQRFYDQAARAGHLEAQTSLGLLLFQNGNRAGAMRWLGQAADAGEPRAMLVYGTALFNGDGVPEDRVRAYAMVSRAAAMGLAPARTTLNEMDQLIPIDERRRGVALAQQWTSEADSPARPARAPAAKAAAAKPLPAAATVAPVALAGATTGAFRIQLGAFKDRASAQRLFGQLGARLGGAGMTLVPAGAMTRLQAGPYPSRAAAAGACAKLRPQPCFPVPAR